MGVPSSAKWRGVSWPEVAPDADDWKRSRLKMRENNQLLGYPPFFVMELKKLWVSLWYKRWCIAEVISLFSSVDTNNGVSLHADTAKENNELFVLASREQSMIKNKGCVKSENFRATQIQYCECT